MSSRKRNKRSRQSGSASSGSQGSAELDAQSQAADDAEEPAELNGELTADAEPKAPVASEISELKPRRRSKRAAEAAETDRTHAALDREGAQPLTDQDGSPNEEDAQDEDFGDETAAAETAKEAPKTRAQLKRVLESLIFVSDQVITAQQLGRITKTKLADVREMLAELSIDYEGRGIELVEVNGGFQFRSAAACGPYVRVLVAQKPVRLTRAQLETLALIAYRQPITRPEVDDVRGVDSGSAIKVLLERELIKILGRKDEAGRPLLYGTTPFFLEFFGMNSMQDLPTLREFTELSAEHRELFQRKTNEIGDLSAEAEIPMEAAEYSEHVEEDEDGAVPTDDLPPDDAQDLPSGPSGLTDGEAGDAELTPDTPDSPDMMDEMRDREVDAAQADYPDAEPGSHEPEQDASWQDPDAPDSEP